jgi:hypothetical protein
VIGSSNIAGRTIFSAIKSAQERINENGQTQTMILIITSVEIIE